MAGPLTTPPLLMGYGHYFFAASQGWCPDLFYWYFIPSFQRIAKQVPVTNFWPFISFTFMSRKNKGNSCSLSSIPTPTRSNLAFGTYWWVSNRLYIKKKYRKKILKNYYHFFRGPLSFIAFCFIFITYFQQFYSKLYLK